MGEVGGVREEESRREGSGRTAPYFGSLLMKIKHEINSILDKSPP